MREKITKKSDTNYLLDENRTVRLEAALTRDQLKPVLELQFGSSRFKPRSNRWLLLFLIATTEGRKEGLNIN